MYKSKMKYRKNLSIIIGCIFVILIFVQNQYVYMYFDDYGYASLSYGWNGNRAGMSYRLKDIFEFLLWHYLNWGGRILYFFFEILIFRFGGLQLMQIVQAVIIACIGIIAGMIISELVKTDKTVCIAMTMVLYGTMAVKTLKDGVCWYSASVLYVWPLLPLFLCIYLFLLNQKEEKLWRSVLCSILAFAAAFSQEQIAVVMIVFSVLVVGEKYIGKDKIPTFLVYMCVCSCIGGALTISAPGNFKRADIYGEFYEQNFVNRTIRNIGLLINSNVGKYNVLFIFILTAVCGTAMAIYFKSRKLAIVTCVYLGYFIVEQCIAFPKEMEIVVRGVWILSFLPVLILYYYRRKSYLLLELLLAGICSQVMMIVSPTVPIRSHIMMEYILQILLLESAVNLYRKTEELKIGKVVGIIAGIGVILCAGCNLVHETVGYAQNYKINQENHYALLKAKERYTAGNDFTKVKLQKLYDDTYANMMPYQEGYEFIEEWMKNYYELPNEVEFEWNSLNSIP